MTTGIVLFAHGSSDAEWALPFVQLARRVRERLPDATVTPAYLEHLHPSLDEATASLVAAGAATIIVAPIFLAPGGHVKRDLSRLVEALRLRHSHVQVRVLATVGEVAALVDAMADWVATEAR